MTQPVTAEWLETEPARAEWFAANPNGTREDYWAQRWARRDSGVGMNPRYTGLSYEQASREGLRLVRGAAETQNWWVIVDDLVELRKMGIVARQLLDAAMLSSSPARILELREAEDGAIEARQRPTEDDESECGEWVKIAEPGN